MESISKSNTKAEEIKRLLSKSLTNEPEKKRKSRERSMEKMRELTKKLLGDGLISNEMASRYTRIQ